MLLYWLLLRPEWWLFLLSLASCPASASVCCTGWGNILCPRNHLCSQLCFCCWVSSSLWLVSFFPGVEVGKDQEFAIDTRGAGGQGKLDVTILSPSRKVVPCLVAPMTGRESSTAKYIPREEGLYAVDVTYDGHPVHGSPYTVEASLPPDPTKVSFHFCSRTCPLLADNST